MVIFKGLQTIIREQIRVEVNIPVFPMNSVEAIKTGQYSSYNFGGAHMSALSTAFRWGYSVWGVDTIIGKSFPTDL